ncbi:18137_t:CDS:2 [Funneliformis geosporum]|uniref:18137_t:CDS:1 n=1 Tax=Funneliformis geosporum TaxID=1117311 RepID=A0A9W4SKX4_9GLOM|nr:18137_t:CDS:2 [Funneliformis geosporum]
METTLNTFEVSATLSSREANNIIYFPDLVNPPLTNSFIDKTVDMDIDYPFEDENALEEFIIAETQGFLVKLERELRPRPQFYALTRPGTNPVHLKKKRRMKNFTIKSGRKSTSCDEISDYNGETPQKQTTRKKSLSIESPLGKKISTNSEAEGEEVSKLPEEINTENKRDAKKGSGSNRGRPKGSLNRNKKNLPSKKQNSRKSEIDTSNSSLTSISPNDSPTPKKRKYNRVSESSKKSNTSPSTTPASEGGLEMILNMDHFVVNNTTATMNSVMTIVSSP